MRLEGDRNVCAGCGELFRSVRAFDMHRTGSYGRTRPDGTYLAATRRCKSPEEMQADGMQRNGRGLWITKAFGMPLHIALETAREAEVIGE
jgi:hypothetical protein